MTTAEVSGAVVGCEHTYPGVHKLDHRTPLLSRSIQMTRGCASRELTFGIRARLGPSTLVLSGV